MNTLDSVTASSRKENNNFEIVFLKNIDNLSFIIVHDSPLGLVNIFRSGQEWSHMSNFIYKKCCAKGFFSEISILYNKWLLKIAVFLFNGLELEKVLDPHYFLILEGVILLQFFPNPARF